MHKSWSDEAWADYVHWQTVDKKTPKRINALLRDIDRGGYAGIGEPEALRGDLSGWWSRRIDAKTAWCTESATPSSRSRSAAVTTATHRRLLKFGSEVLILLGAGGFDLRKPKLISVA